MAPWNRRDEALAARASAVNRVILVDAPVSSTNTRLCGRHWPAAPAIAGALPRCRGGLALRRAATFFERQPEMTDPRPQAADADLHRVIVGKPGLQLDQRDVGLLRQLSAQRLVIGRKLRLRPAARLVGRHVAGCATPAKRLVNIRHADPKHRRGRIDAEPAVHRRHHPLPKVLRVGHAHDAPQRRFDWPENHGRKPNGIPLIS